MTLATPRHSVILFTGRFGSGKTEAAINYALAMARGEALNAPEDGSTRAGSSLPRPGGESRDPANVVLVDLDIITPYFRSREAQGAMSEYGVEVIAPSKVGQHIHTPAITPQILGAIEQVGRPTVLDVGGDRQGARALGQYSAAIRHRGYTMHFVVNPFRPFTGTLDGLATSIAEIEASARLKVTSLVSNPNLMGETVLEQILEGHKKIEGFGKELGLPVAFICLERQWTARVGPERLGQRVLPLDRFFVHSWEH